MDSTPKMDSAKEEDKEILTVIGPKDLTHIVKGKRTKRQRPQSPIPNFTITSDYINNINSSPAHEFADTTTEEDQDTAKCLILLSQGPSPDSPNIVNYNINHEEDHLVGTYKFTSKKYIETSTTGNGKAGIYVYECKTCNRTFPSFQALGGHRASHKKPKAATNPEDRKRPFMALSDEEEPPQFKHSNYINNSNISSGLSLQLSNRPAMYTNTNNKNNIKSSSKVHECAICGAEFTSGQALGGHMRRHRGPVAAAAAGANTTLSLSPSSPPIGIDHQSHEDSNKRAKYGLCLDLNLPAAPEPEEEQPAVTGNNRESTTTAAPKLLGYNTSKQQNQTTQHHHQQQKQQSPLVLSAAPTLVDCHY